MEFIKHRLAKANRAVFYIAADLAANGIAILTYAVNKLDHFFGCCRIGAAYNVFFAFCNKLNRIADKYVRRIDFTYTAYMGNNFYTLCFKQQFS